MKLKSYDSFLQTPSTLRMLSNSQKLSGRQLKQSSNNLSSTSNPVSLKQMKVPKITPTSKTPRLSLKLQLTKNSSMNYKLLEKQIKTNLESKRNHYFRRAMQKIHTDSLRHPYKYDFSDPIDSLAPRTPSENPQGLYNFKPSESPLRVIKAHQKTWIESRKLRNEFKSEFLENLYEQIDHQNRGFIYIEELVESLVELGVASEPDLLENAIRHTIAKPKEHNKIDKAVFFTKFVPSKITNIVVSILRPNKSSLIFTNLIQGLRNIWSSIQNEFGRAERDRVYESLWKFSDDDDFKKMLLDQLKDKRYLKYSEFQDIFLKDILLGILQNLESRVKGSIFNFKRSLFLSGIKCYDPNVSYKEGAETISAYQKYLSKKQIPINEFSFANFKKDFKKLKKIKTDLLIKGNQL